MARSTQQSEVNKNATIENLPPTVEAATSAAEEAGLRYVSDTESGITRKRSGKGFYYLSPDKKRVSDEKTLRRIKSLAVPPAWKDVWICKHASGHLQATGRDARGRKQYRYHLDWRQIRDENKYNKMLAFGAALPKIRKAANDHLGLPGLPKEKVLATVVSLLEKTLIRVGNEEYAKSNDSFGLTTLKNKHVEVKGSKVRFTFKGKSGIKHAIDLTDRRIARIIDRCQALPGQELFQYVDDEEKLHSITSQDVNDYLKSISGEDFTAKDFRTWAGTILAARALHDLENFKSTAEAKRNIVKAIETVAKKLGNTKAVCRKCYVHPTIFNAYMDGSLRQILKKKVNAELIENIQLLSEEETAVLAFLQLELKTNSASTAA